MRKKILLSIILATFMLASTHNVSAVTCSITKNKPDGTNSDCGDPKLYCLPATKNPAVGTCEDATVRNSFGQIKTPPVLGTLLQKDPTGAGAISMFLSNGITLFYVIATIALIFMLLWGAFDWMTSGGDKEKLAGAQRKMVNAVIGILLFAVAFAVIQVLGQFTGFKFFEGQK